MTKTLFQGGLWETKVYISVREPQVHGCLTLRFPWPSRMRNIHSSSSFSLSCSAVTWHLPKQILLNIVHLLQSPNMHYQGVIQFIIVGSRQLLETVDKRLICIFSDNFGREWEIQLQDKGCWENLYDSLPICRK